MTMIAWYYLLVAFAVWIFFGLFVLALGIAAKKEPPRQFTLDPDCPSCAALRIEIERLKLWGAK